ncbi:unnamed protein product [Linum trigynum]|uniref:Uncharacterized protein n=1 Tax=Linum trigynum TaxID=586398 RepID=A0AAV2FR24_9ROSI
MVISLEFPAIVPTVGPPMTTARFIALPMHANSLKLSSGVGLAKKRSSNSVAASPNERSIGTLSHSTESIGVERVYIAGYQDGSMQEVEFVAFGVPVTSLDFCLDTLLLAVGTDHGLYTLTSHDTAITSFSHDKVLAAAADAAFKVSFNQKKKQDTTKPGILGCLAKSFKGCKPDQNLDASQMCHTGNFSHLEGLFAKPPAFPDSTSREPPQPESDSSSLPPPIKSEKEEELSIDDIVIDDLSPPLPQPMTTTSKQPKKEKRGTISYQPFSHCIEHC